MTDYYCRCLHIANSVLQTLRESPPRGEGHIDTWLLRAFENRYPGEDPYFKDVLAILTHNGLVEVDRDFIAITDNGRIHIAQGGFEISFADMVKNEDGLLVPKGTVKRPEPAYQLFLSDEKRNRLLSFLQKHTIVNNPERLLAFLGGDNRTSNIEVSSDKVVEMSLIFDFLLNNNLLTISSGKGVIDHFEKHISPFSKNPQKEPIKAARKKANGVKWSKSADRKVIEDFLNTLKSAYIFYLISLLK